MRFINSRFTYLQCTGQTNVPYRTTRSCTNVCKRF